MNIYLIGFMGCGKTYLGQRWSRERGMDFIDLDVLIENQEKLTINEIFNNKGELYFRERERETLLQTASLQNTIIACGGGTPCFLDNISWMRENGRVIYLKVSEEILFARLSSDKNHRPLIKDMSDNEMRLFIHDTLNKREPIYAMAHEIVENHR